MPLEAKVLLVEDNEEYRLDVKRYLIEAGYSVIAEIATFEEFLDLRAQLIKSGIKVAIVDANLTRLGGEGSLIASWLKKNISGIKIIANSGGPCDFGDIFVLKRYGREYFLALCETVRNL